MGGVGEAEDVVADEVGGGLVAEATVVGVGRDDRKLFDDLPVEVRALSLLSGSEVETHGV